MTLPETFVRQRRIKGVSTIRKRSIKIAGHPTSISLEEPFWLALKEMAASRGMPLAKVIAETDATRSAMSSLSSALRVAVLAHALGTPAVAEAAP
jgi:predicted DNA-binding ribbon-helix-helix protein